MRAAEQPSSTVELFELKSWSLQQELRQFKNGRRPKSYLPLDSVCSADSKDAYH